MRLCSATILYYPGDDFFDFLLTYAGQVDKMFVVDNSETGAGERKEKLLASAAGQKIQFIANNSNLGIASSLNAIFNIAATEGFDWVLTMDQDSYFDNDRFFQIARPMFAHPGIGIIAASYTLDFYFRKDHSAAFYKLLIAVTSGNFVNTAAWKDCGGFEDKLFIDEVDNDFCLRLADKNYLVLTSREITLQHKLGLPFSIKTIFMKKPKPIGIHHPQRMYFTVRNGLYVMKRHLLLHPAFSLNRAKHLSIKLFLLLFFYPGKKQYFLYFCKGVKDFVLCRYGPAVGAENRVSR